MSGDHHAHVCAGDHTGNGTGGDRHDHHADEADSGGGDGGSAGSDVDTDEEDGRAPRPVAGPVPNRGHVFAPPRAPQHRVPTHGSSRQHQQQRRVPCRQAHGNPQGPRIIDRRAAPAARGLGSGAAAGQSQPVGVDRRPRASATVPMLPLCETADDAQAVRALSGDKRYAVVRRLGSGASSSVFLACDRTRADALVAIKVVPDTKVSRSEILAGTFLRGHRSIAAMIDWFSARDHYFLVFEHVDGPDLQVLWAGLPATRAFFAEEAFRRVFLCVLDAVAYCHARGVVHRDIKMENVVVRDDGTAPVSACLVDFGFAFFVRAPHALLDPGDGDLANTGAAPAGLGMRAADAAAGAADHRHRRTAVASAHQEYADGGGSRPREYAQVHAARDRRTSVRRDAAPACIYRRNREGMLTAVRMDTPDVLDATNAFVGTEEYCAPELALGALVEPDDLFATDVYSLGVLLHVALTDRFPQRPEFVHFLIDTRRRLEQAWHRVDPRAALADPRLVAEINRRGALDLATAASTAHAPLSVEVCDLIARMLRPVPAERITLAQVCAHPWVAAGRRRR